MRKSFLLFVLALLPLGLMAQEQVADAQPAKRSSGVFTGFSGGMMLHGGYMFASDPTKVFSNTGLGSLDYVKGLPKDGFSLGLGGMLRCHLLDHIHLGAEGQVSTMPLMHTGSSVRTAWGGALCDYYGHWGNRVRPMVGLSVGGGAMKRLYVPDQKAIEVPGTEADSTVTIYNSSYVKTPFFYIDPYVGMEISFGDILALMIRIDYLLPFNINSSGLTSDWSGVKEAAKQVKWDNFITPSGPRLYVGIMFGRLKRN